MVGGLTRWTMPVAVFIVAACAAAAEPLAGQCLEASPSLDAPAWLRAVSLDLRGVPPTIEELLSVSADDKAALLRVEGFIDDWLGSPEFTQRAVRRHRELLAISLAKVDIIDFENNLFAVGTAPDGVPVMGLISAAARLRYRGSIERDCDFNTAATRLADGSLEVNELGQEGWVEVNPYWAPESTIRVCGFDVQDNTFGESGIACGTAAANTEHDCGCGRDLRYCATEAVERVIRDAMIQQLEDLVAVNIAGNGSYLDLLTSTRVRVNGPLAFFWRHHSRGSLMPVSSPPLLSDEVLPDLPFSAVEDWVEVDAGRPASGVLTTAAFLYRFQTNRGRANVFRNSFLFNPYQPAPGGIDLSDSTAATEPDLQIRNGCRDCHASLEPEAAHWGRFVEHGAGFLDPAEWPSQRTACATCAGDPDGCTSDCTAHYITTASTASERRHLGMLKAYWFRLPEDEAGIEMGPGLLVMNAAESGALQYGIARSTAEWLLGRSMSSTERDAVADFAQGFTNSGYSWRQLVRAIVISPTYRRVR